MLFAFFVENQVLFHLSVCAAKDADIHAVTTSTYECMAISHICRRERRRES